MPDVGSTVATAVLLLVHVPPVGLSLSTVDDPVQIVVVPDMVAGNGLTTMVP